MIDMHIHTNNSDGTDSVKELLEKAENLKLKYISITDHDTCKSYEELKNIDYSRFFIVITDAFIYLFNKIW